MQPRAGLYVKADFKSQLSCQLSRQNSEKLRTLSRQHIDVWNFFTKIHKNKESLLHKWETDVLRCSISYWLQSITWGFNSKCCQRFCFWDIILKLHTDMTPKLIHFFMNIGDSFSKLCSIRLYYYSNILMHCYLNSSFFKNLP